MQNSLTLYLISIGINPRGIPWNLDNAPREEQEQWEKFAADFVSAHAALNPPPTK